MKKIVKELEYKVIIEQDEDGVYVASVPHLPGCYTQGKTIQEVRERVREAIMLVLRSEEDITKNNVPVKPFTPLHNYV